MKINLLVIALAATVFCDVPLRDPTNSLSESRAPELTGTSSAKETSSLNRKTTRNKGQQRSALNVRKDQLGLRTNGRKSKSSASGGLGMQRNSGLNGRTNMQQAVKKTQQLSLMSGRSNRKLETQTRNRSGWGMQQRSLSSGRINGRSGLQRIAKTNSFPKGWPSMQPVFINKRRPNLQELPQRNGIMYQRPKAQGAWMKSSSKLGQSMNRRFSSSTGVNGRLGTQQRIRTDPFFKKRSQMQRGVELNRRQGAQGRAVANGRARASGKLVAQKETGMGGVNSKSKSGSIRSEASRRDRKTKSKQGSTMKDESEMKSKIVPKQKLIEE